MKKRFIIILLCLVSGLFSCTQTNSSRKKSEGKNMTAGIDSSYYLQDTIHNPYKKAEGTTEKRDCNTSIWIKDTNNDKNTTATTTKSTAYPKKIIDEIHSSSGLFCDSEKLKKYTEKIDIYNVINVVNGYQKEYGHSIFKAIMRNVFLSSEVRVSAVKHIKDMYMQAMKRESVYADDIDKSIDGHIEYEKNKFGRMNSKLIDRDMRFLTDRYKQTKWKENTVYPANGKVDAKFNQGDYILDCWLIAAIKSISVNPKGREMLEDLISLDDKGNVTVKLKGVGKKYTMSKEELEGANELAQGDLDARAIEIAIRKYFHETDHNLSEKIKNRFNGPIIHFDEYNMYRGIHTLSRPYHILFGEKVVPDSHPNKDTIDKIKTGKYSTVVGDGHAFAVLGADDKYVYLSDPRETDKKRKLTHKDFIKSFNVCYSMKLSD